MSYVTTKKPKKLGLYDRKHKSGRSMQFGSQSDRIAPIVSLKPAPKAPLKGGLNGRSDFIKRN